MFSVFCLQFQANNPFKRCRIFFFTKTTNVFGQFQQTTFQTMLKPFWFSQLQNNNNNNNNQNLHQPKNQQKTKKRPESSWVVVHQKKTAPDSSLQIGSFLPVSGLVALRGTSGFDTKFSWGSRVHRMGVLWMPPKSAIYASKSLLNLNDKCDTCTQMQRCSMKEEISTCYCNGVTV